MVYSINADLYYQSFTKNSNLPIVISKDLRTNFRVRYIAMPQQDITEKCRKCKGKTHKVVGQEVCTFRLS